MQPRVVVLPTELVVRYRAVDREVIGSARVDTPRHLDALTEDVRERGVLVPLQLAYNELFAALDGNHRIAVAVRLGLREVPVLLVGQPLDPRPTHARTLRLADLAVLRNAPARPPRTP